MIYSDRLKRIDVTRLAVSLVLFLVSAWIFYISPVRGLFDSRFALLLSEQLLANHRFSLTEYFPLPLDPAVHAGSLGADGYPYHIEPVGDALYYLYPPGSSILSLPVVAALRAAGLSCLAPDAAWLPDAELEMQRIAAALLSAAFLVVVYFTATLYLGTWRSAALALMAGFCTPIWSTTSRVVWSDTWGILVVALLLLHLARALHTNLLPQPVLVATLLAWLYVIKPSYAPIMALVGAYVVWLARATPDRIALAAATGLAWLGLFAGYSLWHFDALLPTYYRHGSMLTPDTFWSSLARATVSPSRGLFVTTPVTVTLLVLAWRHAHALRAQQGIGWLCVAAIALSLLLVSFWPWAGGHCYGPRLLASAFPWMALLGAIAWRAALDAGPRRRFGLASGLALLSVIVSAGVHARGACSAATMLWNLHPTNIDADVDRLWDWSDPQPAAGLVAPPPDRPGSGTL